MYQRANYRTGSSSSPTTVTTVPTVVETVSDKPRRQRRQRRQRLGGSQPSPYVVMSSSMVALVMVFCITWAVVYHRTFRSLPTVSNVSSKDITTAAISSSFATQRALHDYTCPPVKGQDEEGQQPADNFDPIRFQNHYLTEDAHTRALEDFVAHYRETPYDDWGQTYEHMKAGMRAWKQRAFVPYIRSGDRIYESAIGLGLNALMTLEILLQEKRQGTDDDVKDLVIYGNEYLVSSTVRANEFLDRVLPDNAQKGNICVGDSTNISYVPSNSFDFVYTGYILPIGNPLHFDQPDLDPYGINHGRYHELCDGHDWRDVTLRDLAQRRQEDFYAAWVSEMIRIAKPGKPVVVEHVSQPKCDDREDWGTLFSLALLVQLAMVLGMRL